MSFSNTAILVTSDGLGQGKVALRHKLAASYFRTLFEGGDLPRAILFYTDGVKLVTGTSPCLAELKALADAGVPLIICRTCLDFYGLIDKVAVGEIGNMMRIVEEQGAADKVITI
jgi:selenium metabolism protein YedF